MIDFDDDDGTQTSRLYETLPVQKICCFILEAESRQKQSIQFIARFAVFTHGTAKFKLSWRPKSYQPWKTPMLRLFVEKQTLQVKVIKSIDSVGEELASLRWVLPAQ